MNCQFGNPPGWQTFQIELAPGGLIAIASVQFPVGAAALGSAPRVYLRMDGTDVTAFNGAGSGTVNCQYYAAGSTPGTGAYEAFRFEPQPDGTVAIGSVQFPHAYLRMDGTDVTAFNGAGSGTVNCQYYDTIPANLPDGSYEKFRLVLLGLPAGFVYQ